MFPRILILVHICVCFLQFYSGKQVKIILSICFIWCSFVRFCEHVLIMACTLLCIRLIMAPSKKSKSEVTTSNILRALRKTWSAANPQPCPENSSLVSVKRKAIYTNLQNKLTKKRKKVDQHVPNNQEGLKILKRGVVTMHRIVRRKDFGNKVVSAIQCKG